MIGHRVSARLRLLSLVSLLATLGCASFGHVYEKPRVSFLGAKVTALTLVGVNVEVELEVVNPNGIALVLEELDYHAQVNGEPILDGRFAERTEVAAHTTGRVKLPLSLRFADVKRVVRSVDRTTVRGGERSAYDVSGQARFLLPVVGEIKTPIQQRGDLPLEWLTLFGLAGGG